MGGPGSGIMYVASECGIAAITPTFQVGNRGSTPLTRTNLLILRRCHPGMINSWI